MPDETTQDQEQINHLDTQTEQPVSLATSSHSLKSIWVILPLLLVILGGALYFYMTYFMPHEPAPKTKDTPLTQQTIRQGKLLIGTDATYPPMEFEGNEDNLLGYDIEFGNKIATELGVEAEFVNISWDDIFTVLENEEIDVIISSVTITDERKQLYDFSAPYLNAGQVIITQNENTTISDTADLQGKKIGVQEGTTNQEQALLYTEPDNVIAYADFIEATQALVAGDVDAIFSDLTNAKSITVEHETLKIASDPFTSEQYGIVIKKGKESLVRQLDKGIDSLKQKGYLELLKQKWLE